MPRIANCKARPLVSERRNFRGNNTYGRTLADGSYAVFSYGEHWPLYVYWRLGHTWYSNAGRYSRSTSKHASQLRPYAYTTAPLPTEVLIALVEICDGDVQRTANWSRRVDAHEEAVARRDFSQPAHAPVVSVVKPCGPRRLLPLGR